ncbi:MAG: hypothetical protein MUC44_11595 [Beijerinckiaceae bacterium]|nr:hypothetical protein [Beijerinckiaceae bacterium]
MTPALNAGLFYGSGIFALGFVLGTVRELWLAPLFGRDAVVLFEGPLILLAAWFLAWWLIRGHGVAAFAGQRLVMGAVAFGLLMCGEAAVATFGYGRTLAMHLATYATTQGMLETMPQIAFALFPLLHLIRERFTA